MYAGVVLETLLQNKFGMNDIMKNFVVHVDDLTKYAYYGGLVGKWVESDEVNKEVKHVKYVDWEDTLHIYLEECNYCE